MTNELRADAKQFLDRAFVSEQREGNDGTASEYWLAVSETLSWVAERV
ncbi:hypothetical protein H7R52_07745 [Weissella confusa]|uniref:Uncharacterized protein n=1 Tax=Weissella confusa TaxID=1583 RepID=A0A923NEM1_WEICO|nr:hypothetical protein [Weissella confusa]MBC6498573.1 hypothetical protein [Weissella confusa]